MSRQSRLADLEQTAKEYISAERKRAENEVKVLEAVLSGRTGGAGIQKVGVKIVASVANADLAAYLRDS